MLISVIMPVYNTRENYLRSAIESILAQSFSDFEFIIIDDGSDDYISDIVKSYNDNRIKYVYQQHTGVVGALNKGLELATGKYIARMDSDDISLPTRFEEQVNFMEKNPDFGLCGSLVVEFNDKGGIENHFGKFKEYPVLSDLLFRAILCHPSVLIRKSILDRYNITYSNSYPYAEDQDFWHQIMKHSKIHVIQKVLLHYRRHDESLTSKHLQKGYDSLRKVQIEIIKEIFPDIAINNKNCKNIINILRQLVYNTNSVKNIQVEKPLTLVQKIFSVKNEKSHKIIRFLFFKIKIKKSH